MWRKSRSIAKVLEEYTNIYKNAPGVLDIQNDGFSYETIVVFFDRDKLEDNLPSEYKNIPVNFFDVKQVLADSKIMLTNIINKKIDLSIQENKAALEFFTASIKTCTGMLKTDEISIKP